VYFSRRPPSAVCEIVDSGRIDTNLSVIMSNIDHLNFLHRRTQRDCCCDAVENEFVVAPNSISGSDDNGMINLKLSLQSLKRVRRFYECFDRAQSANGGEPIDRL